jgi:hypothetical protein
MAGMIDASVTLESFFPEEDVIFEQQPIELH